jgi:hypothetical protein
MKKTLLAFSSIAGSVFFAGAQITLPNFTINNSRPNFSGPMQFIALAQTIASRLIPFLVSLAVLAFFWFLVMFIWKGRDSSDAQAKGRLGMFYSLVAIFVMVSMWGIIVFIGNMLGINQGGSMSGFKLPGER